MLNVNYSIGRNQDNDFVLSYPQVSDRHAKIVCLSENTFIIEDLDSSNGTYLNNFRVKRSVCTRQDQLQLADVNFDLDAYFNKAQVKQQLQNNVKSMLGNAVMDAPPKAVKTDPNDFTQEFKTLEIIYKQYNEAKIKLQAQEGGKAALIRSGPATLGMYGLGALIPGWGWAFGIAGSLIGILACSKASNPEKLIALDDEFKISYACPRCRSFLGYLPWRGLAQRKTCDRCKAIWAQ
jgi:hypothetical protein